MSPRLSLAIQLGEGVETPPLARPRLRRLVTAALDGDAMLTLRFVAEEEGRALNRDYRQRDYPTNVLTFDYDTPEGQPVEADIVVCLPVVAREAAEQGKPLEHHLAHLVVHGVLHAQGWDHETGDDDAAAMEARERTVLARFGIPDPYLSEAA